MELPAVEQMHSISIARKKVGFSIFIQIWAPGPRRDGGNTYDEAEREEGTTLDDMGRHVPAVVALTDDSLVSWNLAPEGVFAAEKEEEHDEEILVRRLSESLRGISRAPDSSIDD